MELDRMTKDGGSSERSSSGNPTRINDGGFSQSNIMLQGRRLKHHQKEHLNEGTERTKPRPGRGGFFSQQFAHTPLCGLVQATPIHGKVGFERS